jgi:hypothetical protein
MNKQMIEKAIGGLEQLKPVLQMQLLRINYEGLGREDAKDLGEHFSTAIKCMRKQLNSEWITDDLPQEPDMEDEERDEYIVTLNKYSLVPTVLYYLGKGKWAREYDEPSQVYDSVLAWKKMPEIYKEESDA